MFQKTESCLCVAPLETLVKQLLGPQDVKRSFTSCALHPRPRVHGLPFACPPKWAAESTKRLKQAFPKFVPSRQVLFLKALIHPSYTTPAAKSGTMASLSPLGQQVLQHEAITLVSSSTGASSQDLRCLSQQISSAETLSAVVKSSWGFDDLILTDAIVKDFREAKSHRGLLRLVQSSSSQVLPLTYYQQCVFAMIGAVFLERGLDGSRDFLLEHVLPPALEYLTLDI